MAQPTTALLEPDDNDQPQVCPAGLSWCLTECADPDGYYHGSDFAAVTVASEYRGTDELSVSVHRKDTGEQAGPVHISVLTGKDDLILTPQSARQHAAHLLNAADTVDPLPLGETVTTAGLVRLGDELLTGDGWQTVTGLMAFTDSGLATVFTAERGPDTSDGWEHHLADVVRVRRHGGLPLLFVEPLS